MKIPERIDNPVEIDVALINKEIENGKHVIVQFSDDTYTDRQLSILNDLCRRNNEEFGLRFYAHYSKSFDFNVLLKIPDVKCLYVDCLLEADNIHALESLNKLEKLSLGVFELKDMEILRMKSIQNVSNLIVTETRSRALNLDHLRKFSNLRSLVIGEHTKNIEAVGELPDLEFLSLNSIKKTPIHFVNRLKKLKTLKFVLGGRKNIQEIEENEIENLEIVWVRGFNDLSNIPKFRKLKTLLVEDNIRLQEIHFADVLNDLENLKIINCKGLKVVNGMRNLPKLEQLRVSKTAIDFDAFMNQEFPRYLKTFAFYTSKSKVNVKIRETLDKLGYTELPKT